MTLSRARQLLRECERDIAKAAEQNDAAWIQTQQNRLPHLRRLVETCRQQPEEQIVSDDMARIAAMSAM